MFEMYRTHYKVYVAWALQYRMMLVLWAVAGVVQTLVALAIWKTVAVAAGGEIGGYQQSTFAAYFVLVMLVGELTHTWVFWQWDWRVREGLFSSLLLQPMHPLHADIVDNIATKSVSLAVKVPIAVLIGSIYGAKWTHDGWAWAAFSVSLVLAYSLRTLIEAVIACSAFWLTKINAVVNAHYLVFDFLSGQFAPVELLPEPLRSIAEVLPFRWCIDFPVQLAMGRVSHRDAVIGLGMLVAWNVVMFAVFKLAWRVSAIRYSAVGS